MRFSLIFSIVSLMTILCGLAMAIPGGFDILNNDIEGACRLFISAAITVAVGTVTYIVTKQEEVPLRPKEMFMTTTLTWTAFALFSALPFYLSYHNISFTDAFFESMSGLTTTGATVLTGLDQMNHGLLLWRSFIQWLGGVGIIIVAITVLPNLSIGGMQFFSTESSERSDKSSPKTAQNLRAILIFFLFLSAACALCLWLAGMSIFDAVNHAMTTIATGGFSTHDASLAYYKSPAIEWVITFFMAVAGLPLIIGLYIYQKKWQAIKNSEQIFTYLFVLAGSIILLTLYRWNNLNQDVNDIGDILRLTALSVISVVTTTGYCADNYNQWGNFVVVAFLFLYFTGACTGSTSGGVKMMRHTILFKALSTRMKSVLQPHGVFIARYGGHPISDRALIDVMAFMTLFLMVTAIATLALSFLGLDLITSMSAALTAIANVGPGLGPLIGPDKTFAPLPGAAKWILSVTMLLGRLEFIAIVMLLVPFSWKKNI